MSFSIKTFIEILAILSTPWLITTLGVKRCLGVAAVIAICAFLTLANVQSLSQLVVGASLEGLYYGIFAAVGLLYIQSFAGDRLGRATSLYTNSLYIGALIASSMMGLVAQLAGFRTVILLSTVWATLALLVLIVSGRTPTRLS
nr:MFS transporter [Yoonia maritima]